MLILLGKNLFNFEPPFENLTTRMAVLVEKYFRAKVEVLPPELSRPM